MTVGLFTPRITTLFSSVYKSSRKRIINALVAAILGVTTYNAVRWYQVRYVPIDRPDANLPSLESGDIDATMRHCKLLLEKLRAVNWDPDQLPRKDFILPDYALSEWPSLRSGKIPTVYCRGWGDNELAAQRDAPETETIAFYTDIYVRQNAANYQDAKTRYTPEGFYVVAWKDGRVTQVPVQDVRWVPGTRAKVVLVFPGLPTYDAKAPKLSFVEFADGVPSLAAWKAYVHAAVDTNDVGACRVPAPGQQNKK